MDIYQTYDKLVKIAVEDKIGDHYNVDVDFMEGFYMNDFDINVVCTDQNSFYITSDDLYNITGFTWAEIKNLTKKVHD